jgi:hypothetical protein
MSPVVRRERIGSAGRASGAASARLPAGLVITAYLAGVAAGIVAIAALATLLALLLR